MAKRSSIFAISACLVLFFAFSVLKWRAADSDASVLSVNQKANVAQGKPYLLTQALNKPTEALREHALDTLFRAWIKEVPHDAVQAILRLDNTADISLSFRVALPIWFAIDKDQFNTWLATMPLQVGFDDGLSSVLLLHDRNDGEAVFYASKLYDADLRQTKILTILQAWLSINPAEALAWIVAGGENNNEWLAIAFEQLSKLDPQVAFSHFATLDKLSASQEILIVGVIAEHIDPAMLNNDVYLVLEYLKPYTRRELLIGELVPVLFRSEIIDLKRLHFLVASLEPGEFRDKLHQLLAFNWAHKDPKTAAQYAESLDGDTRELTVNAVISSWVDTDLLAAHEWLKTLDGDLDLAATSLAQGSARKGNMEIADNWLGNIVDETMRTDAIYNVVDRWYQDDPKVGVYYLVHQKQLSTQQKLDRLHNMFPDKIFLSPEDALRGH